MVKFNFNISKEKKKNILNIYVQPLPWKSPQYLLWVVQSSEAMSAAAHMQFQAYNMTFNSCFIFIKDKITISVHLEKNNPLYLLPNKGWDS